MIRKTFNLTLALLFFVNSVSYGLGIQPASKRPPIQGKIMATAERTFIDTHGMGLGGLFAQEEEYGPPYNRAETLNRLEKNHAFKVIPADYDNPPAEWGNNPILGMTDFVEAFEHYAYEEAGLSRNRVKIERGKFTKIWGGLPIARYKLPGEEGENTWRLVTHEDFIQAWNDIRKNDIWFRCKLPNGEVRTISLAWGIFYWIAKHEMTDLQQLSGEPKMRPTDQDEYALGHLSNDRVLDLFFEPSEVTTNYIGGNYAIINAAIKLWFMTAYAYKETTQLDTDTLLRRARWYFDLEAQNEREDEDGPLYLEFPLLLEDINARKHAFDLLCAMNDAYFIERPGVRAVRFDEDNWEANFGKLAEELAKELDLPGAHIIVKKNPRKKGLFFIADVTHDRKASTYSFRLTRGKEIFNLKRRTGSSLVAATGGRTPAGEDGPGARKKTRKGKARLPHSKGTYGKYDRFNEAVNLVVNPRGGYRVGVQGFAQAGFREYFLATDACESYFVDTMEVDPNILIEFRDTQDEFGRYIPWESLEEWCAHYLQYKKEMGFFKGSQNLRRLEGFIMLELKLMGVSRKDIEIEKVEGLTRITFKWVYPGRKKKKYTVTYIKADMTKAKTYKEGPLADVLARGIGVYYHKAAMASDEACAIFLPLIASAIKNKGYLVTDDCYSRKKNGDITVGYTDPEPILRKHGINFNKVETDEMREAAEDILLLREERIVEEIAQDYTDAKREQALRFGFYEQVRQIFRKSRKVSTEATGGRTPADEDGPGAEEGNLADQEIPRQGIFNRLMMLERWFLERSIGVNFNTSTTNFPEGWQFDSTVRGTIMNRPGAAAHMRSLYYLLGNNITHSQARQLICNVFERWGAPFPDENILQEAVDIITGDSAAVNRVVIAATGFVEALESKKGSAAEHDPTKTWIHATENSFHEAVGCASVRALNLACERLNEIDGERYKDLIAQIERLVKTQTTTISGVGRTIAPIVSKEAPRRPGPICATGDSKPGKDEGPGGAKKPASDETKASKTAARRLKKESGQVPRRKTEPSPKKQKPDFVVDESNGVMLSNALGMLVAVESTMTRIKWQKAQEAAAGKCHGLQAENTELNTQQGRILREIMAKVSDVQGRIPLSRISSPDDILKGNVIVQLFGKGKRKVAVFFVCSHIETKIKWKIFKKYVFHGATIRQGSHEVTVIDADFSSFNLETAQVLHIDKVDLSGQLEQIAVLKGRKKVIADTLSGITRTKQSPRQKGKAPEATGGTTPLEDDGPGGVGITAVTTGDHWGDFCEANPVLARLAHMILLRPAVQELGPEQVVVQVSHEKKELLIYIINPDEPGDMIMFRIAEPSDVDKLKYSFTAWYGKNLATVGIFEEEGIPLNILGLYEDASKIYRNLENTISSWANIVHARKAIPETTGAATPGKADGPGGETEAALIEQREMEYIAVQLAGIASFLRQYPGQFDEIFERGMAVMMHSQVKTVPGITPDKIKAARDCIQSDYNYIATTLKAKGFAEEKIERLRLAFALGIWLHSIQKRASRDSRAYFIHSSGVARIVVEKLRLLDFVEDEDEVIDIICAAFLHDSIEDVAKGALAKSEFVPKAVPDKESFLRRKASLIIGSVTNARTLETVQALTKVPEGTANMDEFQIEIQKIRSLQTAPFGTRLTKMADWWFNFGDLQNAGDGSWTAKFVTKRLPLIAEFLGCMREGLPLPVREAFVGHVVEQGRLNNKLNHTQRNFDGETMTKGQMDILQGALENHIEATGGTTPGAEKGPGAVYTQEDRERHLRYLEIFYQTEGHVREIATAIAEHLRGFGDLVQIDPERTQAVRITVSRSGPRKDKIVFTIRVGKNPKSKGEHHRHYLEIDVHHNKAQLYFETRGAIGFETMARDACIAVDAHKILEAWAEEIGVAYIPVFPGGDFEATGGTTPGKSDGPGAYNVNFFFISQKYRLTENEVATLKKAVSYLLREASSENNLRARSARNTLSIFDTNLDLAIERTISLLLNDVYVNAIEIQSRKKGLSKGMRDRLYRRASELQIFIKELREVQKSIKELIKPLEHAGSYLLDPALAILSYIHPALNPSVMVEEPYRRVKITVQNPGDADDSIDFILLIISEDVDSGMAEFRIMVRRNTATTTNQRIEIPIEEGMIRLLSAHVLRIADSETSQNFWLEWVRKAKEKARLFARPMETTGDTTPGKEDGPGAKSEPRLPQIGILERILEHKMGATLEKRNHADIIAIRTAFIIAGHNVTEQVRYLRWVLRENGKDQTSFLSSSDVIAIHTALILAGDEVDERRRTLESLLEQNQVAQQSFLTRSDIITIRFAFLFTKYKKDEQIDYFESLIIGKRQDEASLTYDELIKIHTALICAGHKTLNQLEGLVGMLGANEASPTAFLSPYGVICLRTAFILARYNVDAQLRILLAQLSDGPGDSETIAICQAIIWNYRKVREAKARPKEATSQRTPAREDGPGGNVTHATTSEALESLARELREQDAIHDLRTLLEEAVARGIVTFMTEEGKREARARGLLDVTYATSAEALERLAHGLYEEEIPNLRAFLREARNRGLIYSSADLGLAQETAQATGGTAPAGDEGPGSEDLDTVLKDAKPELHEGAKTAFTLLGIYGNPKIEVSQEGYAVRIAIANPKLKSTRGIHVYASSEGQNYEVSAYVNLALCQSKRTSDPDEIPNIVKFLFRIEDAVDKYDNWRTEKPRGTGSIEATGQTRPGTEDGPGAKKRPKGPVKKLSLLNENVAKIAGDLLRDEEFRLLKPRLYVSKNNPNSARIVIDNPNPKTRNRRQIEILIYRTYLDEDAKKMTTVVSICYLPEAADDFIGTTWVEELAKVPIRGKSALEILRDNSRYREWLRVVKAKKKRKKRASAEATGEAKSGAEDGPGAKKPSIDALLENVNPLFHEGARLAFQMFTHFNPALDVSDNGNTIEIIIRHPRNEQHTRRIRVESRKRGSEYVVSAWKDKVCTQRQTLFDPAKVADTVEAIIRQEQINDNYGDWQKKEPLIEKSPEATGKTKPGAEDGPGAKGQVVRKVKVEFALQGLVPYLEEAAKIITQYFRHFKMTFEQMDEGTKLKITVISPRGDNHRYVIVLKYNDPERQEDPSAYSIHCRYEDGEGNVEGRPRDLNAKTDAFIETVLSVLDEISTGALYTLWVRYISQEALQAAKAKKVPQTTGDATPAGEEGPGSRRKAVKKTSTSQKGLKIVLLVDDNKGDREALEYAIEREFPDATILPARDEKEAIGVLKRKGSEISACVFDWHLAGPDRLDKTSAGIVTYIQGRKLTMPIIIISNSLFVNDQVKEAGIRARLTAVLAKIETEELVTKLKDVTKPPKAKATKKSRTRKPAKKRPKRKQPEATGATTPGAEEGPGAENDRLSLLLRSNRPGAVPRMLHRYRDEREIEAARDAAYEYLYQGGPETGRRVEHLTDAALNMTEGVLGIRGPSDEKYREVNREKKRRGRRRSKEATGATIPAGEEGPGSETPTVVLGRQIRSLERDVDDLLDLGVLEENKKAQELLKRKRDFATRLSQRVCRGDLAARLMSIQIDDYTAMAGDIIVDPGEGAINIILDTPHTGVAHLALARQDGNLLTCTININAITRGAMLLRPSAQEARVFATEINIAGMLTNDIGAFISGIHAERYVQDRSRTAHELFTYYRNRSMPVLAMYMIRALLDEIGDEERLTEFLILVAQNEQPATLVQAIQEAGPDYGAFPLHIAAAFHHIGDTARHDAFAILCKRAFGAEVKGGKSPQATGDKTPGAEEGPGRVTVQSYADKFYEFVLRIGRGEGPGSAEEEEKALGIALTQAIHESVNTLHASKIKIYMQQTYGGFTSATTGALRQIRKRTKGALNCRMFSGKDRLEEMLEDDKQREESGQDTDVKRLILIEEGMAGDIDELLEKRPDLFVNTRLLNVILPKSYLGTPESLRTIRQLEMITISILARLLENGEDSAKFIRQTLKELLIDRLRGIQREGMEGFLDKLGIPDKEVTDIKFQIRYFLNRAVSLIKNIDHEMRIMRVFWTYA